MSFLLLLNDLLQFRRHGWNVLAQNLHFTAGTAAHDDVEFTESFVFIWIILTEVATAALTPFQSRTRDGFVYGQKIGQIERRMPTAVVFAIPLHGDLSPAPLKFSDFLQTQQHFRFGSYNADELLHFHLQFVLYLIRTLGVSRTHSSFERFQCPSCDAVHLVCIYRSEGMLFSVTCRKLSSAFPEHQEIGQRIAAEPVRTMEPAAALTGREKARHRGHLSLRMNPYTAHDVVHRRSDFHGCRCNVDIRQLFELMVHAG